MATPFKELTGNLSGTAKRVGRAKSIDAKDPVNHPSHYTFGKFEVIDVIEDWKLGLHLGNVVKYVARAEHKGNPIEDLKKARWYLNRKIEKMEMDLRGSP